MRATFYDQQASNRRLSLLLMLSVALLLAALGFLLHQRVDQFLVLLSLAGEVFGEFAQSAIQARLAFLYCVLHHLQVLLQLVALFAPLGQRVDVPLQAGHVGIGVLLEAGLQVVEAVLGVLQLACHFAVLVVERIPPFAVGLLFGLKLPLVAVEFAFQIGDLPLGLFAGALATFFSALADNERPAKPQISARERIRRRSA